ncbi:hypothetical protein GF312_09290 [Candidatus Poribacteria bacterium]|nr:hypothetical protein [Candidatus Poribacteria bacterium]
MIAVLFTSAYVVKRFIKRDRKTADAVRKELGKPDRVLEFQDGFDHWKIEWYGEKILAFRNGYISEKYPESVIKNKEKNDIK